MALFRTTSDGRCTFDVQRARRAGEPYERAIVGLEPRRCRRIHLLRAARHDASIVEGVDRSCGPWRSHREVAV
jgi:hypothetical protein